MDRDDAIDNIMQGTVGSHRDIAGFAVDLITAASRRRDGVWLSPEKLARRTAAYAEIAGLRGRADA